MNNWHKPTLHLTDLLSKFCNLGLLYLGHISPPGLHSWNVCHADICWNCNKPFLNLESWKKMAARTIIGPPNLIWYLSHSGWDKYLQTCRRHFHMHSLELKSSDFYNKIWLKVWSDGVIDNKSTSAQGMAWCPTLWCWQATNNYLTQR